MREDSLRKLAKTYAQLDGQRLVATPVTEEHDFASLDARVLARARTKRRPLVWGSVAAAVVVGLVLAIPLLSQERMPTMGDHATAEAPSHTEEQAVADEMAQEPTTGEAASDGAGRPQPIPLSFTLPTNLSVAEAKVDEGLSVYLLQDLWEDDVVLTMAEGTLPQPAGLRPYTLRGQGVLLETGTDYNRLWFVHNGITYQMTCRMDIRTLLALGEEILL